MVGRNEEPRDVNTPSGLTAHRYLSCSRHRGLPSGGVDGGRGLEVPGQNLVIAEFDEIRADRGRSPGRFALTEDP